MIQDPIAINVTFPNTGLTYRFSSIRAVARMLSGTGRASGGLRRQISRKALANQVVRNNRVEDAPVLLSLPAKQAA